MKVKQALGAAIVLLVSDQIKEGQALVIKNRLALRIRDDEEDTTATLTNADLQSAEAEVSQALAEQADADEADLKLSQEKKQEEQKQLETDIKKAQSSLSS